MQVLRLVERPDDGPERVRRSTDRGCAPVTKHRPRAQYHCQSYLWSATSCLPTGGGGRLGAAAAAPSLFPTRAPGPVAVEALQCCQGSDSRAELVTARRTRDSESRAFASVTKHQPQARYDCQSYLWSATSCFSRRRRWPPRRRGGSSMTVSDSDPWPRTPRGSGGSAVLLPGLGLPGRIRVTGICD